ncbi:hypothetical protein DPMN_136192 [Dreissena polymorpha]|uniref:G-protein coupled receptors family 1 profile domain-containing protein n=1 Tax=Dreissena polymorpha TaxID=45954 RepID=A0A9D4JDJ5_DREPO|nr:hypothetical protein DPMN_136192 [Dreissena polymorpha]
MEVHTVSLQVSRCWVYCALLFVFNYFFAKAEEIEVHIIEANVTRKGHQCNTSFAGELSGFMEVFNIYKIVSFILVFTSYIVMYSLIARKVYKSEQKMLKHHINEHSNKALDLNKCDSTLDDSHIAVKCAKAGVEANHIQNRAQLKDIREETAVKQRPRNTKNDINRKITLMLILMALASFLAFTPYFVIRATTSLKKYEYPWWMALLFHAYVIQSNVNPFIIGSCNSEFRVYILRCRSVK